MNSLFRCAASGLLKRCGTLNKILRCGGYEQWQEAWNSLGCGTCSGGSYPGVWETAGATLSSSVSEEYAGTVVIDGDLGTAVSYGQVYATGTAPTTPDTTQPTISANPCNCGQVFYVYCRTAYTSVQSCAPSTYNGGSVSTQGTDDICYTDDGGCSYSDSPPYWICDGCTWINAIPATGRCNKRIAGPFCTDAEGDAWIVANCGGGGVLDEYYTCCGATVTTADPRCP